MGENAPPVSRTDLFAGNLVQTLLYRERRDGMGMEIWRRVGQNSTDFVPAASGYFRCFLYPKHCSKKYHPGFIVCVCLIFAGALGNLIDSMFYGLVFSPSDEGLSLAKFLPPEGGYAGFLHGKVVDMLYAPIIENKTFPEWLPFWGGERFTFFSDI